MTKRRETIAAALEASVAPEITGFARQLAADHGAGTHAIIAYGSCIRGVATVESLIDFYLITVDFKTISSNVVSQIGCRLLPPNVYYAEFEHGGQIYRSKYAAMTMGQLRQATKPGHRNPYFWARFMQPCRLVYCRNEQTRGDVLDILDQAAGTAVCQARRLGADPNDPQSFWSSLLQKTYATELRSEGTGRPDEIYRANAAYYQAILNDSICQQDAASPCIASTNSGNDWRWRSRFGKLYSIARLLKAAFTFKGGADYLAWKISRHSGEKLILSPWQRRHPILAALHLLPKLLRSGSVK